MADSEMECKKICPVSLLSGKPKILLWEGPRQFFGRLKVVTAMQRIHHPHSPAIRQIDGAEIGL